MTHSAPLAIPKVTTELEKLISIGLWVDGDNSLDISAQKAKGMRYDAVEIHGFGDECNPFLFGKSASDGYIDLEVAKELAGKIADQGLVVSGFAGNFHPDGMTMTTDEGMDQYFELFQKFSDYAKVMGAQIIRVDGIEDSNKIVGESEFDIIDRMGQTWAKCADYAQQRGQYITMEFEPEFVGSRPSQIVAISNAVKKYVSSAAETAKTWGILYDTCHGQTVAIEGHKQFGHYGELTGDARETFRSQLGFITYPVTNDVNINHVHIIGSDGSLHDNKTSAHIPIHAKLGEWTGPGQDAEDLLEYATLLPHLFTHANLNQNIWTVDTCFRIEGMAEAKVCLPHMREFARTYKHIAFQPMVVPE